MDRIEWELLFSYYQVAERTTDQEEREAAIGCLKSYTQKPESQYRDQVTGLLKQLETMRGKP